MKSLKINRENLDEAINFLNENLNVKIFIIQKIKLISMFHDLLDNYKNESIFVSSSIDEIKIRLEGKNKLPPIPPYTNRVITMYNGKIELGKGIVLITIKTINK